jgi:hypothetical protein
VTYTAEADVNGKATFCDRQSLTKGMRIMIKLRCIRICVDDKRRCIGDGKKYFVYKAGGYLTWKFVIVVSSSQLQTTKKRKYGFLFFFGYRGFEYDCN